jgi:hypothetical protein
MTERYQRLLELTRNQRVLIDDGDWAGAAALGTAWEKLVASLPEQAPAEARAVLEEAASIAWSNTAALQALAAAVSNELGHLGRGRRAIASYAGADGVSLDARV